MKIEYPEGYTPKETKKPKKKKITGVSEDTAEVLEDQKVKKISKRKRSDAVQFGSEEVLKKESCKKQKTEDENIMMGKDEDIMEGRHLSALFSLDGDETVAYPLDEV